MGTPIAALSRAELELRYRRTRLVSVVVGILLVVAVVMIGVMWQGGAGVGSTAAGANDSNSGTADAAEGAASCPVKDRRDPDDFMAIGDIDAPVVMHEWTDFRCPWCGKYTRETMPELIKEYVDTGKVRIEIHDAALVGGEESVKIAGAARAAGVQSKYFEFLDGVYEHQGATDNAALSDADLTALAKAAGVADLDAFDQAVAEGTHEDAVRESTAESQQLGVSGVPFFALSDCASPLSGAQTIETFRAAIDAKLEETK